MADQAQTKFCSECGTAVLDKAKFCSNCGTELSLFNVELPTVVNAPSPDTPPSTTGPSNADAAVPDDLEQELDEIYSRAQTQPDQPPATEKDNPGDNASSGTKLGQSDSSPDTKSPTAEEHVTEAKGIAYSYLSKGLNYVKLGQHEQAIQAYNEAIRLDPQDAVHYFNRGTVYLELRQHDRAIEDYNEAIRLNPEKPLAALAYFNRGTQYLGLRQAQRAAQDYDEAIRLDPSDDMYREQREKLRRVLQNEALARRNSFFGFRKRTIFFLLAHVLWVGLFWALVGPWGGIVALGIALFLFFKNFAFFREP